MKRFCIVFGFSLLIVASALANTQPVVSNVVAVQRPHTALVDVTYDVADADGDLVHVTLWYSLDGGVSWDNECVTVSGDVGAQVAPGTSLSATWDAGADVADFIDEQFALRVYVDDGNGGAPDSFVLIPAGTFTMGSPSGELGRNDNNETQHTVTLTKGFYMSPVEVTEGLWDQVMGSGTSTSQKPKANVTWYDAVEFCNALSVQRGLTPAYEGAGTSLTWNQSADGYRLPTEAEWEYACRAGSTTAFANGGITETDCGLDPNLDAMGWYCYNSGQSTHDVGVKLANSWGLYDMHGNVWELCWDQWNGSDYSPNSVTDPVGSSGSNRVIRGGSWYYLAMLCRSALRDYSPPSYTFVAIGVRLVRSAF